MMRGAMRLFLAVALAVACAAPRADTLELPDWFAESFLEFPQDVKEAAGDGKRLMLYFWQDGCPSCRRMKETTFADPAIIKATRAKFVPVAINTFGERELLDERGLEVLRRVGYQPADRYAALLGQAKGP